MIFILINALLTIPTIWVGWRYIKTYMLHDPLWNIPGPPSTSFLKGNARKIFNTNAWQFHTEITARFGGVIRMKTLLGRDCLYVSDPRAMHHILIKDQHIYEKMMEGSKLLLGEGLLGMQGDKHRKQRRMLNPLFSIVHMREMIPTIWDVSRKLHDTLTSMMKDGAKEIDMHHWISRVALELIGQNALGYSFDPLTENAKPHPYSIAVEQLLPALARERLIGEASLPFLMKMGPAKFRRWVVDMIPSERIRKLKYIIDVMHNTSVDILKSKRKASADDDESVVRPAARGKDITSILLKANMEASEEDRLSEDEILSQMSTFILAGTETTATVISRILHLISTHPDVQDKLRCEVSEAIGGDRALTYEELESLRYLDAVCRETLRLYPPVSMVSRYPTQDMTLPLYNPSKGVDGRDITEIYVPKNIRVIVSIIACNRRTDIWGEDALEWKPERWLSPLPDSVKDAHIPGVYSNMMTFLSGSRACIGFKFAQLEMKVVISLLVKNFKFTPSEKDIVWAMHGVATPSVVGLDQQVPTLPLSVSLC